MWPPLVFAILVRVCFSSHYQKRSPCDTVSYNSSVIVKCSGRNLLYVPSNISWNATRLELAKNRINKIYNQSFWNLRNLTFLNIKWNKGKYALDIENQTFVHLVKLKVLLLDGNLLSKIPEDLPSGLKVLSLNFNNITSVGTKDFKSIPNIKVIRLNKNCYSKRTCSSSLLIDTWVFSNLSQLTNLSLSYNRLMKIPPNLPHSLTELVLALNRIENITKYDLEGLKKLKLLDLSGNCPKCSTAPFPCTPCNTTSGSMDIHPHAFRSLSELEELRLSGNSLRKINAFWFQSLTSLKYLYLSFNFLIDEIAVGAFLPYIPRVEILDLSFNNNDSRSPRINLSPHFSELVSLRTLHMESYIFQNLEECNLTPLYSLRNLSTLNLGTNFLENVDLSLFTKFFNISVIYLSENKLTFSSRRPSNPSENVELEIEEQNFNRRFEIITHKDGDYRQYPPLVKQECLNYGSVLDLSKNNIFYFNPYLFQGVKNIGCLNLSFNSIGASLNGTEFISFPNLKYIDLSYNKLYLGHDYAFSELKSLEVLDLSNNKHYFVVTGLKHNLIFLKHLEYLKVLNLSWNEISILSHPYIESDSLQKLQFQGNRLDVMWKADRHFELFRNLKNLTHLDISYNMLRHIPPEVYCNFPKTLTHLSFSRNGLEMFEWDKLTCLPQLEELDLSKNSLVFVSHSLHADKLKVLILRHNKIDQLADGFLTEARSLATLDLSYNQFHVMNRTAFLCGSDSCIEELHLEGNPLYCTCAMLDFMLWLDKTLVPHLATGATCDRPPKRKNKELIYFDIEECVGDSEALQFYLISSVFIISSVAVTITAHLFYWDFTYIFHYWKAKVKGYRHLSSAESMYDAFITYDTRDPLVSEWVLNHLRLQLEGQTSLSLCLEEKDWVPGSPVIDCLSQSIRQSRKTIFVLTEAYVRTGVFKMAVYLAHQRLLEEDADVMVLLLLEPVLPHSRFLRLRRRLCGASVLEWPRNPSAEQWFWQCLRKAIRTENQAMYSKLYSSYFSTM